MVAARIQKGRCGRRPTTGRLTSRTGTSLGATSSSRRVAVAGFAEAGKLWAGDSPFGVNTPLYASAGVSILAASPPQSRRTLRADFAFPVRGERKHNWEVRLIATDLTRMFRVEPRDIYNNRERSVPASVFNWP